jgi:lysyl-tRNA synthetase class 2
MSELEEQIRNRRAKRESLRRAQIEAYPRRFEHDLEPADVGARFGERGAEELAASPVSLRVPGRVRAIREHGRSVFIDLHDGRGKLQLLVRPDRLPAASRPVLDHLDLGDYLGAAGTLIRSRTGELTLETGELTLLAKALRPLPEKWHGLTDVEARYRQRYLDLVANPEARRIFEVRADLVRGIRRFLDRRGFLEVETPMMQALAGGAAARPFVTRHHALDLELFLRIAPELYLKRLLVGGLHRVYEINRNFRNEGVSTQHSPEFTMLEFYWAYADYRDLMELTEELLVELALDIQGGPSLTWQGERLELGKRPWERLTVREAVARFAGIPAAELERAEDLERHLRDRGIATPALADYGHLLMALFESLVEPHLVQPTFILDVPVEVSPLAKQRSDDPRFTERFELFAGGMEVANAFTELNDPDVQAERFREQLAARERGDEEAHRFDHDYIRALEHGMPPAAGEGMGIDRLTMLFTDRPSIRDVILFPLLRPEVSAPGVEEAPDRGTGEGRDGSPEATSDERPEGA